MSFNLVNFDLLEKLPAELKNKIKIFHIGEESWGKVGFCVTYDDKVYGFGYELSDHMENIDCDDFWTTMFGESPYKRLFLCNLLGYNNLDILKINKLCNQNIDELSYGFGCWNATNKKHIFSWELNEKLFIEQLKDFKINKISGYRGRVLALTTDGQLYYLDCEKKLMQRIKLNEIIKNNIELVHYIDERLIVVLSNGQIYELVNFKKWRELFDYQFLYSRSLAAFLSCRSHVFLDVEYEYIHDINQLTNWSKHFGINKISLASSSNIVQISCGRSQGLALSSEGILYGWGFKSDGQPPKIIQLNDELRYNIKSIHCTDNESFVVTLIGDIFQLTDTGWHLFVTNEELAVQITGIEGNGSQTKINDINIENSMIVCQTQNGVYQYLFKEKDKTIVKTDHKNLFDYYLCEQQSTYKTIHLIDEAMFATDIDVQTDQNTGKPVIVKNLKKIDSNAQQFFNKFKQIEERLPKKSEITIKSFFCSQKYEILSVMTDNTVVGLKNDNIEVIQEFCDNIEEFFEGNNFMFARNDINQIFGWGLNDCGQLGRGFISENTQYLEPKRIEYFDDKNIVDISCGDSHCLALSSDHQLYGWGDNSCGQTGCEYILKDISVPTKIQTKDKFKFIHCFKNSSYAVTIDGKLYFWGETQFNEKIISSIELLNINKFLRSQDLCLILTEERVVYRINIRENDIKRIESLIKFNDIFITGNHFALQSKNCVYELNTSLTKAIKTNFSNFHEYYLNKHKITFKTLHITKEGYLITEEIEVNEEYNESEDNTLLKLKNRNVFCNKFETNFELVKILGEGGYGKVYQMKDKQNGQHFAIKKIETNSDQITKCLREVNIWCQLNSEFVVKYMDAWIEGNVNSKPCFNTIYIKMEMCSQTLNEVMDSLHRITDQKFQNFIFWISCQLFTELIECVQYLHSFTPPIIHRDLYPSNVLISDGRDGRFVKLGDFGTAKEFHEKSNQTPRPGNLSYMAPEVRSQKYNQKADIYSLALIGMVIFKVERARQKLTMNTNSKESIKLLETLSSCLFTKDYDQRPDCEQLLNGIKECTVDTNTILMDENVEEFRQTLREIQNSFLKTFFESKSEKN